MHQLESHGDVKVVDHVSFDVRPGQCMALVGESGCGKSTTANVMCGLQSPTSGHVYFKGMDVTKRTPELESRLAALSLLSSRTQQLLLTLV